MLLLCIAYTELLKKLIMQVMFNSCALKIGETLNWEMHLEKMKLQLY